jgi:hypothetical protein
VGVEALLPERISSYCDNEIFLTIDTTPPTGSIVINGGDTWTNSSTVTLTISASDPESGVTEMRIGNGGEVADPWEPYDTTKTWALVPGENYKQVWVRFKNGDGFESINYGDFIYVDTTPPTGSIAINGGAASTTSQSVTLALTYSDPSGGSGVDQVRYSNDEVWDIEPWESLATSKAWTLIEGDGQKIVYYQVKDVAGNIAIFSDSINLETPPIIDYDLTVGVSGSGDTSPSIGVHTYEEDTAVAVTASAESGWSFSHWLLDSVNVGSANPYTVTMDDDYSLTAMFVEIPPDMETLYFDVHFEDEVYVVETCSNSSVADLVFSQSAKRIMFSVEGEDGTVGFCDIAFPAELLSGDFTVFMDDVQLVKGVDYTEALDGTHYSLSISYEHGSHVIEVFGSIVIPDFAAWLFLPFLMLATLLGFALRKRLKKNLNPILLK